MIRSKSAANRGQNSTPRTNSRSLLLTSTVIAVCVAANAASCRDFRLDDTHAAGKDSSAGSASAGTAGAGTSSAGAPISSDAMGGSPTSAGNSGFAGQAASGGGGGDDLHGGGGYGGSEATNGGLAGDAGASGGGASGVEHIVAPSQLSGLSLWLESAESSFETSDSRVSMWKDSSGNGNDATQLDMAQRPLLALDAINGWQSVKFEGAPSSLVIADDGSLQFGTQPFTIAFVGEWHNSEKPDFMVVDNVIHVTYPGYGTILTKVAIDDPYDGIALFANYAAPYSSIPAQRRFVAQLEIGTAALVSTATDLNNSHFRLYVVQRSAPGMLEERINGTTQGRLEIPAKIDASAPGRSLHLGNEMKADFQGSIAEVVMLKGPVSDPDLQGLEQYLMHKFGL